jgi:3-hydroxy acid dehydrogenase/malonic semialdehyde reductase
VSLSNKTIFITGATAGFGAACARQFIAAGARVVATGRREDRLAALKKELGKSVHTITLDVRSQEKVSKAVDSLPKGFSEIDILINNAGLALGLASLEQQKIADLEQMVQTNILGVLYCTSALLPGMIKRNLGHIVNLSSIAGTYPYPGGNVYGATKAFITQFSLNLRADLLGKNIRVSNIEPGMCETEFSLTRFKGDKAKADSIYAGMTPLTADDIARTIVWCVSQPAHVNINRLEVMPVQQAFSPFAVSRKS